MTGRQRVHRGDASERAFGYCQAVRTGNLVHVSGVTGRDRSGVVVAQGDAAGQARQALENLRWVLAQCDATLNDVVRTRLFLTSRDDAAGIADVHREFFAAIEPAATLVIVAGLFSPELLVEIEADVVIAD